MSTGVHPLTISAEKLAAGWLNAIPVNAIKMQVNKKLILRIGFEDVGFMLGGFWIWVLILSILDVYHNYFIFFK